MNISLASFVLQEIGKVGVREFCLCAGARNSPLVMVLEKAKGIKIFNFFDERSAAFFAIGRMQAHGQPVAVVTTSGTAVAELLPATVEAYYSGWPLINITADRPRSYRGTGAPQTIEQLGIFSRFVETIQDIEHPGEYFDLKTWTRTQPIQINVCFDEPLIDEEVRSLNFDEIKVEPRDLPILTDAISGKPQDPLIVVGPLKSSEIEKVAEFLEKNQVPFFAESSSGLRKYESLKLLHLEGQEKTADAIMAKSVVQSVLRIGGVPTLRLWRDLEGKYKDRKVYSVSGTDFTGLSRAVHHRVGWHHLQKLQIIMSDDFSRKVKDIDREIAGSLTELIEAYPRSEVGLLKLISEQMDSGNLYLGNSLPIREWDLIQRFSAKSPKNIYVHRGANGIDGQISGFLGSAAPGIDNWCVVGDLTALYDLSALWVSPQMATGPLRLVVINNAGGQIFKNIFGKEIFLNTHQLEFSHWAKMFGWDYIKWNGGTQLSLTGKRVIIELVPEAGESDLFWKEYSAI